MKLFSSKKKGGKKGSVSSGSFNDIRPGDQIYTRGWQSQFEFVIIYR